MLTIASNLYTMIVFVSLSHYNASDSNDTSNFRHDAKYMRKIFRSQEE